MAKINTRNEIDNRTLENSWKLPVLSSITTPPTNPNNGDRHRIISPATGIWTGKENQIAIYEASNEEWFYETYGEGSILYDLDANDYRYVKSDNSWEQFDKIPLAISDVTGLQTTLNSKESTIGFTPENSTNKDAINGYAGLDGSSKLKLAQFPSGNADEVLKRNSANNALEFDVVATPIVNISSNSITDTEIASHTSTKMTITNKSQLNSSIIYENESNVSTVAGAFLQPSTDNQGNIGTASKRYASIRAVLIQSGDIILSDKKTGKKLYRINEDKEGITFETIRGKKIMRILRNGNLLVRGKVIEGVKF